MWLDSCAAFVCSLTVLVEKEEKEKQKKNQLMKLKECRQLKLPLMTLTSVLSLKTIVSCCLNEMIYRSSVMASKTR